jgi:hypothetical protein
VFAAVLKKRLDPEIQIIEVDTDINSHEFAQAVVNTLLHNL